MKALSLFAAIALLAASAAQAGVVIETVERNARTGKTGDGTRMSVQGGAARIDTSLADATDGYVIFRDGVIYSVEPKQRRYTAMDRETVTALAGQMGAAMNQMRAELAKMPPQQRAMMEQMMGNSMPGAKAPRASLVARDLGRSEKVDGRTCRLWELSRAKVVENQICVVPFAALPGKEDLLGLMKQMNELMKPMAEAMEGFGSMADDAETMTAVKGFPVLWRDFENGAPTGEETVLRAWREENVPAALLRVPEGYRKQDPLAQMQR